MNLAKPLRLLALLAALVLALASCKEESPPVALAHLSKDVRSHHDWISDSKRCPLAFVASTATKVNISNRCRQSGHYRSCKVQCETGNAGACYWLAQGTIEQKADEDVTEALFQRSCKLGAMSGCTNRAAGMLNNDPAIQRCTSSTFQAVCTHGDPWACTMLAHAYEIGQGIEKNPGKALAALEKSCTNGQDDPACVDGMEIKRRILREAPASTGSAEVDTAR